MSWITAILTSIAGDLVVQILVIVGALAVLVGVFILAVYGFRKLRSAGLERSQQSALDIVDGW